MRLFLLPVNLVETNQLGHLSSKEAAQAAIQTKMIAI